MSTDALPTGETTAEDDEAFLERMAEEYEGGYKGRLAELILQASSSEEEST